MPVQLLVGSITWISDTLLRRSKMNAFSVKRRSLSHECEVRVTLQNEYDNPVKGKTLTCDLMALINDVTISPFAPLWFPDVVSGAIEKFGYAFEVHQSELLEEPFF